MIRYAFRYLYAFSPAKINALTCKESIDYLVEHNISLIRWGDGETCILQGQDIEYQASTSELRQKMTDIVNAYNQKGPEGAGYLLAMPLKYLFMDGWELLRKRIWINCWVNTRYIFKCIFDQKKIYADAALFSSGQNMYYSKIWEDASHIIFVHGDIKFYRHFVKTYNQKSYFVQIPPRDSFAERKRIEKDIIAVFEKNNLDIKKTRVLISAGPAAKVIAYDLAQKGYICIDTGHCWDDPPLSKDNLWIKADKA